jgi:hypothetical protein
VDVVKIYTQSADHYVIAGLARTLAANPRAAVLIEFWLDAMDLRGLSALDALAQSKALGRPMMLRERPDVAGDRCSGDRGGAGADGSLGESDSRALRRQPIACGVTLSA